MLADASIDIIEKMLVVSFNVIVWLEPVISTSEVDVVVAEVTLTLADGIS